MKRGVRNGLFFADPGNMNMIPVSGSKLSLINLQIGLLVFAERIWKFNWSPDVPSGAVNI